MSYVLKYREPGKRRGTRWALRRVESVKDALAFMNANKDKAFMPAWVQTPGNQWQQPEVVAILRDEEVES